MPHLFFLVCFTIEPSHADSEAGVSVRRAEQAAAQIRLQVAEISEKGERSAIERARADVEIREAELNIQKARVAESESHLTSAKKVFEISRSADSSPLEMLHAGR